MRAHFAIDPQGTFTSCRPLHSNSDWLGDGIVHVIRDEDWCNMKLRAAIAARLILE